MNSKIWREGSHWRLQRLNSSHWPPCAIWQCPAAGADFGQPFPGLAPPLAADRVEFASNWYVRGDLAYAQETYPNIAPFTSASPSVLNTFSAGSAGDTRSTITSGRTSFSIIAL